MGIKTPKYFKTISMFGKDNQEHHGILGCLTMYLSTLANFLCSFSCLPVNDKAKLQTKTIALLVKFK
jgi:hypothetical protein